MKRIYNSITGILLLAIISPLFLILMIAIKLNSKGPVFFIQKRIGENNKEFLLYKFRTMKIETPNVATHLLDNPEQYITSVGKFLRKSSFDELPQLLNILKGDMTYIGPRPALYNQYDLIEMRTKVGVYTLLPGVTGWAQINGRDAISIEKKVDYDEYYFLNKSIIFDIRILFLTVFRILKADGVVEGGFKVSNEKDYGETASL